MSGFTADQLSIISRMIRAALDEQRRGALPTSRWRLGTTQSELLGAFESYVLIDGDSAPIPCLNGSGGLVPANARVKVVFEPPQMAWIDRVLTPPMVGTVPHEESDEMAPAGFFSPDETIADMPGPLEVVNFEKYLDNTLLVVELWGAVQSDAANEAVEFYVNIGGTDYDIGGFTVGDIAIPHGFALRTQRAGIPRGTWDVRARWQQTSGPGGNIEANGNCFFTLVVRETYGKGNV